MKWQESYRKRLRNQFWKTKSGKLICIKDMETDHIVNTLAMLKRNGFISQRVFDFFYCGIKSLCDFKVNEYIDPLEEELKTRVNEMLEARK